MLVVRQTCTSDTIRQSGSCVLAGQVAEGVAIGVNHLKARAAGIFL